MNVLKVANNGIDDILKPNKKHKLHFRDNEHDFVFCFYLFLIRSEAIVAVNDPATAIPTNIVITPTKRPAVVIG